MHRIHIHRDERQWTKMYKINSLCWNNFKTKSLRFPLCKPPLLPLWQQLPTKCQPSHSTYYAIVAQRVRCVWLCHFLHHFFAEVFLILALSLLLSLSPILSFFLRCSQWRVDSHSLSVLRPELTAPFAYHLQIKYSNFFLTLGRNETNCARQNAKQTFSFWLFRSAVRQHILYFSSVQQPPLTRQCGKRIHV